MGVKAFFSLPFAKLVVFRNNKWKKNPIEAQEKTMFKLVSQAKKTVFGKDHSFERIQNYTDFKNAVPIRDYEGLRHYVEKIIAGEKNVLWPGSPIYFCKTSGTTSGVKHIPVSKDSLPNHLNAARDAILSYISETKKTNVVNGKMIFLQGSPELSKTGNILTGRLSGIVAHHIPSYLQWNQLPSFKTNCIEDWEKKIDKIVDETESKNMSLISGIPPWVQMYFEKLKKKHRKPIKDLFPNFSLFIYGGVSYEPYRNTFRKLIGKNIDSIEVYPASEGFIAYQDSQKEEGMLLCVDNGIFYEFIPAEDFFNPDRERLSLSKVSLGVNYVIILNTNAGLWGYNIGDTVRFVSTNPYRIIVSGRIKHFTSAFGEHVISEEVERSLKEALDRFPVEINEFHVAPEVNPDVGLPYHEWFIEFEKEPKNINDFKSFLNDRLQKQNTYYKDLLAGGVLRALEITVVSRGGFREYMRSIGKLGGQNKVPRLANDRKIANSLKPFL